MLRLPFNVLRKELECFVQACISATSRLNISQPQHQQPDMESDDSDDDDASISTSDMSGINAEQYCSLLKSIESLSFKVKLETESESENDGQVKKSTPTMADRSANLDTDGDSCEQPKTEDRLLAETESVADTSGGLTRMGDCQSMGKKPVEKDSDGMCRTVREESTDGVVRPVENGDKIAKHSDSVTELGKDSDRCRKDTDVADDDAANLPVTRRASTSSAEDYFITDDDDDDDHELLIEVCSKKTGRENGCDADDAKELSEGIGTNQTAAGNETSGEVLWKEGDIEVRLESGKEDELSNSPAYGDGTALTSSKNTNLCPAKKNTDDFSTSKMPKTSIRISLSKLTARINGDDAGEPATNSVEESLAGRGRGKGPRTHKPKLRKKRVKLRLSRSNSTKAGKLSKVKDVDQTEKLKSAQDVQGTDHQPEKRRRGRPRKNLTQPVETVFSDAVNGICTRRTNGTSSDGKHSQSLNTSNAVAESNVKSVLKDASVSKVKKRRASRGVEYIDDEVASSAHHNVYTHVTTKRKMKSDFRAENRDSSSASLAAVDANSRPTSDKENEKSTSARSGLAPRGLSARKQVDEKKYKRSYSVTRDRSDVSTHSDGSVTDGVTASSMEDGCVKNMILLKKRRTVSSTGEENQMHLNTDEKLKSHRTVEEMFRQIGRDGLECRFCHRELRTRRQLLQHAKVPCRKSLARGASCSAVDAGKLKWHAPEIDLTESDSQIPIDTESPNACTKESDKKADTLHVDAINGVQIKNCIVEISPITDKTDVVKVEAELEMERNAKKLDNSADADNAGGETDALADCVCDGCGEVVPDCSWLTAHIVTCPGRSGVGDEISGEAFHPDESQWSGEQDTSVLVQESPGMETAAGEAGSQPVEVDAASLLQLLCTVENSLLCTVPSDGDATCQPITVVSDSLSQENGSSSVGAADAGAEVGRLGREVIHDGIAMYEFAEYRCGMCPMTFLDRASAIRHATATKVHAACAVECTSIYCCMQCDMRYRDQQLMWYHVTYICQQSEASAVPASEMHHCAWCLKQFLTAEYLSRHCHILHSSELLNNDLQMTLREISAAKRQRSTTTNSSVANPETQKQVLQALAHATLRNSTNSTPKSRKEAALLRSKLVMASDTLPTRRTAKGIVYKNVFMQCIVSYLCSNCGRDLSTKLAKREHRAAAPDSCFDGGSGGRRLFTYVRHYSYLCPYCNQRSATQKECRAHQLATCLPSMGVKTDELNHKQLLCPFCQRKYFNVITLKGHMTLVHQISRAESNRLLAGVIGASEETLGAGVLGHNAGRTTTLNTVSLGDHSSSSTAPHSAKTFHKTTMASVESVADEDEENSVVDDDNDDSNSVKSESASRDSRFETVDSSLPLFSSSRTAVSAAAVSKIKIDCQASGMSSDDSSDDEDEDVDVGSDTNDKLANDDDDDSLQFPVSSNQHRLTTCRKPKKMLSSKTEKNCRRKS